MREPLIDAEKFLVASLAPLLAPVLVSRSRPSKDLGATGGPSVSIELTGGYPHETNPHTEWLTFAVECWHTERGEAIALASKAAGAVLAMQASPWVHRAQIIGRPVPLPDPDRSLVRYTLTARALVRSDAKIP